MLDTFKRMLNDSEEETSGCRCSASFIFFFFAAAVGVDKYLLFRLFHVYVTLYFLFVCVRGCGFPVKTALFVLLPVFGLDTLEKKELFFLIAMCFSFLVI